MKTITVNETDLRLLEKHNHQEIFKMVQGFLDGDTYSQPEVDDLALSFSQLSIALNNILREVRK